MPWMMNKINSLSSLQNSLFCYYCYAEVVAEIEKEERGNLISVFNPKLSTDYNWQESLYTKLRIGDWNYLIQCVSHLFYRLTLMNILRSYWNYFKTKEIFWYIYKSKWVYESLLYPYSHLICLWTCFEGYKPMI